jgi:hypothetical protein
VKSHGHYIVGGLRLYADGQRALQARSTFCGRAPAEKVTLDRDNLHRLINDAKVIFFLDLLIWQTR